MQKGFSVFFRRPTIIECEARDDGKPVEDRESLDSGSDA